MASAATTTAASTAALPRIGLGIIGAGVIGKRMCDAVKVAAAAGAKLAVAAVCDIDETLAKALADRAVEASNNTITVATTTDYKALVADDNVHIVYIGVPPSLHKPMALAVLAAGKHLICEKPLALSGADANEMATAASAAGAKGIMTGVNLPFRCMPPITCLRQVVGGEGEDNVTGKVRRADVRFRFPQWPRPWQTAPWVGRKLQGGPLREVGTHFYFLLEELFGRVTRVRASLEWPAPAGGDDGTASDKDMPCESGCVADMEVEARNGDTVNVHLDLLCGTGGEEEVRFDVHGSSGTIVSLLGWQHLHIAKPAQAVEALDVAPLLKKLPVAYKGSPEATLLFMFADAIASGTEAKLIAAAAKPHDGPHGVAPASFASAAAAQHVLDAILSSNGEWVSTATTE